jgi:hypothetical protein
VPQVRDESRHQAPVAPELRSCDEPLALGGAPEVGRVLLRGEVVQVSWHRSLLSQ